MNTGRKKIVMSKTIYPVAYQEIFRWGEGIKKIYLIYVYVLQGH